MKSGEFFIPAFEIKCSWSWILFLMQVSFITLKVLNRVEWPWWWVLTPIWVYTLSIILAYLIYRILHHK